MFFVDVCIGKTKSAMEKTMALEIYYSVK